MDINSLFEVYVPSSLKKYNNSDVFNSLYFAKGEETLDELLTETNFDFVVIGLLSQNGDFSVANAIRQSLYKLKFNDYKASILDLGNFVGTFDHHLNELEDLFVAILKSNKKIILIGGEQGWTLAQTGAMLKLGKYFTLLNIDPQIDGFHNESKGLTESFLEEAIKQSQQYLFDYIHLAYQSYLVDELVIDNLRDEEFELIRLSQLREDIRMVEPLVRSSDVITVDVRSVKYSDAPSVSNPLPNGLYGEEFCKLSHYIGFSRRFQLIGFYNVEFSNDVAFNITASQVAQSIWHLLDGFYSSTSENLDFNTDTYLKFLVLLEESGQEIVFYKNVISERWWMSIPEVNNRGAEGQPQVYFLPCSYSDYTEAADGNVPNRWIKAFNRINN